MNVYLKRVYDKVQIEDGKRVLVDRLWPRGISKQNTTWDEWMKDVAPSPELRKWFAHQDVHFDIFRTRYEQELAIDPIKQAAVKQLRHQAMNGNLTLLYAAKSETCNHAIVLRDWLLLPRKQQI